MPPFLSAEFYPSACSDFVRIENYLHRRRAVHNEVSEHQRSTATSRHHYHHLSVSDTPPHQHNSRVHSSALSALTVFLVLRPPSGADPGGVQGVRTPALLIRVPFLKVTVSINITGNAEKTHHFDIRDKKNFCGGGTAPSADPTSSAPSTLDLWCPFQMDWMPALVKS